MTLITRYIARQYFINFVALLVIAFSLVVTIDVIINLGRFSTAASRFAEDSGRDDTLLRHVVKTTLLVIDLWIPRLLQLFVYINGVILIAAMGFTCAQMVRHREFVAMLSAGISLNRAMRPFLVVGAAMILCQGVVQERLIPPWAHLLARNPGDSGKREIDSFPVEIVSDGQNRFWSARTYDDASQTMLDLFVWERDPAGRLVRVITADQASWDGSAWRLTNGRARTHAHQSGAAPAAPTPVDQLSTSLNPTRLKSGFLQGFDQSLSSAQLAHLAASGEADERTRDRLERLRWGRPAGMLCGFLALWATLPFFLVKRPQPMLGPALKASPVAFAGFVAAAVSAGVSIPGIPAWAGAFIPCLILLAITLAIVSTIDS